MGSGAWKVWGALVPPPPLFKGPSPSKHLGGLGLVVAAHRAVRDTPTHSAHIARGSTILSRHHSPSLSIVDEFNYIVKIHYFFFFSENVLRTLRFYRVNLNFLIMNLQLT